MEENKEKNIKEYDRYMYALDIYLTFEQIFNFIKEYQIDECGNVLETQIYILTTLVKENGSSVKSQKNYRDVLLSGVISKVTSTYVVFLYKYSGEYNSFKYKEISIEYESIVSISSLTFQIYNKKFIGDLEKLPPIYPNTGELNYDILQALKMEIEVNKDKNNKCLFNICNQLISLEYSIKDVSIIKNILYFNSISKLENKVIPISIVSGYLLK